MCEDFLSVPDQAQGLQSRLMTQATRPRRLMAPPDHPHDTRQRPVTKSRPESSRDGTRASTRDTTALLLASDSCYVAHISMRIQDHRRISDMPVAAARGRQSVRSCRATRGGHTTGRAAAIFTWARPHSYRVQCGKCAPLREQNARHS